MKIPHLARVDELCRLMPALRPRTVRSWVAGAAPTYTTSRGRKRTIPGNGLAPAIIRRGRIILLDVERFVAWLYGEPRG